METNDINRSYLSPVFPFPAAYICSPPSRSRTENVYFSSFVEQKVGHRYFSGKHAAREQFGQKNLQFVGENGGQTPRKGRETVNSPRNTVRNN